MKQCRPKMMSTLPPQYFLGTVLKPICKRHVAVRKVDGILPASLGSDRVLLREDQAHDFAQPNVLQEELHVHVVRRVLGDMIKFVFYKVFFGNHLNIRVVNVDVDGPSKSHGNRPVPSEQRPPEPGRW